MRILSIDQSTQISGWALFIDKKHKSHGVIDLHKNKNSQERTKEMYLSLMDLIKSQKPDVVVIEDVSMQTNVKTAIILARLQGAIILSCFLKNVPFHILASSQWRKALSMKQGGIKREVLKAQDIEFANDYLKRLDLGEDESDAICINIAYQKILKELKETPLNDQKNRKKS